MSQISSDTSNISKFTSSEKPSETIIFGQNLSKIYNGSSTKTIALDQVNIAIQKGTFSAIIGPSGSGKSTLLHLLAGIDSPTKAKDQKLEVNSKSLLNRSENWLAKFRAKNVGFILQFFGLLPTLTVQENVMMAGYFNSLKPKERKEKAIQILTQVGLQDRLHHYPNQLSGGQKQRVAVSRALVNNPKVLFADEPTGNLDSKTGIEILTSLRKLVDEEGLTLVLVTHDERIFDYADRVIKIMDGKVASDEYLQR